MKPLKKWGGKRWRPLLVLLAAALASVLIYEGMTWYYADWVTAPGQVAKIYQYRGNGGRSGTTHYTVYYNYAVNGTGYQGVDSTGGVNEEYVEGGSAEVWYDPDNPARSSFFRPWPGLYPVLPFIITFPYLGGCLFGAFVRSKKKSRLQ